MFGSSSSLDEGFIWPRDNRRSNLPILPEKVILFAVQEDEKG
jgi:hypothetical protein